MSFISKLKSAILRNRLEAAKKRNPFDEQYAESYRLSPDEPPTTNNSYYFSGHDLSGTSLLFRLALRTDRTELWFVYHDAAAKTFVNVNMQLTASDYVEVECLEVASRWRLSFRGNVVDADDPSPEPVEAVFEGEFTASAPIFEFSRHMDPAPVIRALSREKWNADFRKNLAENHQVHYEQAGGIRGTLMLDGKQIEINLPAVRDHSFGKRDWNYMDRHIWIAALMETGELFNVSMVRYPAVFELQTGYFEQGGKFRCVDSATPMDAVTMSGRVPERFAIDVLLVDGTPFHVECGCERQIAFPFAGGVYTIHEGIGRMKVNGVAARGILEFGYNRDKNRWTR